MATKYFCDRCGAECNERYLVEVVRSNSIFTFGETGVYRERTDLCSVCKRALDLFLNKNIVRPREDA